MALTGRALRKVVERQRQLTPTQMKMRREMFGSTLTKKEAESAAKYMPARIKRLLALKKKGKLTKKQRAMLDKFMTAGVGFGTEKRRKARRAKVVGAAKKVARKARRGVKTVSAKF